MMNVRDPRFKKLNQLNKQLQSINNGPNLEMNKETWEILGKIVELIQDYEENNNA